MKGVVLLGNSQAEVRDFADPEPGPGEVRIKVQAAGICGSDLHFYHRKPEELGPFKDKVVGHEPAGVVDAVGHGVTRLKPGDRVAINHNLGCGHCEYCLGGESVHCADYEGIAVAGRGANAEYMVIPELYCYHLPDELSIWEGPFIACTGATAYGAMRKLRPTGADTVAIFGLGPVGLSMVLVVKGMGARVIGVDLVPERLQLAGELGADETIDASQEDPVAAIRELTRGRGAEMAVEVTGAAKVQGQIVEAVCIHGKVVYVARSQGAPAIPAETLILRELTLMGSAVLPLHLYWEMVRFMIDRDVRFERLITQRLPLEEGPEAFAAFDKGAAGKFVLVPA